MDPTSSSAFEAPDGLLFRRNKLLLAIPIALGVLGVISAIAVTVADSPGHPVTSPVPALLVVVGMLATPLLWAANALPIAQRGALRVTEQGILIDGRVAVRADEITSAAIARFARFSGVEPVVRLSLRSGLGVTYLRVADETEAKRVLAALRLDAAHARASFALPWWPFRWGTALGFYFFALFVIFPCAGTAMALQALGKRDLSPWVGLIVAAPLIAGFWLVRWRSRMQVTLGADGILLSQWGRTRFLPAGEVEEARQWPPSTAKGVLCAPDGFDLVLRSGERIGLYTARERQRLMRYEDDFILERVRETLPRREAPASQPPLRLPSRKGRAAGAWLAELRRVGSGAEVDLRVAPVDPTDLWRVVVSLEAAPADRAAAAAALSASREPPTRARLRVTAASTASPELRAALEAAADGDDPELERALEALDP